ncbi:flavin reductase like domain-containing protein [Apodospora peruviana]|uniref:Flavin reductase like domain-containing protein n=1 Tax=Apodospora peruviana TaxID=516989 RepID=A0AAE0MAH1_9PEZI|nr:flavin reductase like domain-containing protein [Apodospora peruviana]
MSSCRRVLGLSAEHALLLLRNGANRSVNHAAAEAASGLRSMTTVPPTLRGMKTPQGLLQPRRYFRASSSSSQNFNNDNDTTTPTPPATQLPHQFRNLMRRLTHSVVVCTSTNSSATLASQPCAMTMSSFTSLALHPSPAVSFNVATPSRTLDAIASSRLFNIHVLVADASGAKVANWCRQGNAGTLQLFARLRDECQCEVTVGNDDAHPALLQGPGVLHVLKCRLLDEPSGGLVKVRNHVIVLGEVLEILDGGHGGSSSPQEEGRKDMGLSYADRKYRHPGKSISYQTPEEEK